MTAAGALLAHVRWRRVDVPGTASNGAARLMVGEVGDGAPRAVVTAGVHGDEGAWGALAIRTLLERDRSTLRGHLSVVATANPVAFDADARNAPLDQLDLNRTFPGTADGSYTERVAHALAGELAECDVAVDLHGGGSWCVNAFAFAFPGSEPLAAAVGAPFVVHAPEKHGTLTHFAMAHGARAVAIEMGGRSRDEARWMRRIADGTARVLAHAGVLDGGEEPAPTPSVDVGPSRVLRPPHGGIFVPALREEAVGTVVEGETLLGSVLDACTLEERFAFRAPFPRTALLLLRPHVTTIEGGAMTYVVAEPA